MMRSVLDLLFGKTIRRHTTGYLKQIGAAHARASREVATGMLKNFRDRPGAQIAIGKTAWGEQFVVPAKEMISAHSLITGGTGAGKTRFALIVIKNLIDTLPSNAHIGFGVLDPKGELFFGTLLLLLRRLSELNRIDVNAARELRRRIVIVDFSCHDPVSCYNILSRWRTAEPDFFAASRADLLLDLLPGGDGISLGASALLRKTILLLSNFELPITWLDNVLHDAALRSRLLGRCRNEEVKTYFARQFVNAPKQTIAALSRRLDALFSSEGVRLALSGTSAPDFRALQDEGRIILINCFGENISRSVRQLLQALVLSDIAGSIFARKNKDVCFPWFCDEAQNFFLTERLRDHMHDILTMSRSFGSFTCCLTQNIGAAVQDSRMLQTLFTNVRWSFSMRGEPADCAFLKSALPVSGRRPQPQTDPFKEPSFYSLNDERTIEFNAIANLPDRTGYLWFRPHSNEAIKITTAELTLPSGKEIDRNLDVLIGDDNFGMRVSRKEYERRVAERDRAWHEGPQALKLDQRLAESYKRMRGARS